MTYNIIIEYFMNFKKFLIFALFITYIVSQGCCGDNTVKVTGNAKIKVKPDIATITVKATNTAKITINAL